MRTQNKEFAFTGELSNEQSQVVFDFLDVLFDDSKINEYWSLIAEADKALAFGYFDSNRQYNNPQHMLDFICELRGIQRKMYLPVRENAGISKTVRYTDDGEAHVYLFENVKVEVAYIAKTEAKVYPIRLVIDAKWKDGRIDASFKVRLYEDGYKELMP